MAEDERIEFHKKEKKKKQKRVTGKYGYVLNFWSYCVVHLPCLLAASKEVCCEGTDPWRSMLTHPRSWKEAKKMNEFSGRRGDNQG